MDTNRLRWWDGTAWTESLKPAEPEREVSLPPQPVNYGSDPDRSVFDTSRQSLEQMEIRPRTAWLWALTLLPIAHFATVWTVLFLLSIPMPLGGVYALYLGPLVLYPIFATFDRRALISRGYERPPSAALAIVPALYLVVRSVRVTGASLTPVRSAWFLLYAVPSAVSAASFLAGSTILLA